MLQSRILEKKESVRRKQRFVPKEEFDNLIALAPDVFYEITTEGKFCALNPAFERFTGFRAEDFLGKSFLELVHPEDREYAKKKFQESLKENIGKPYELRITSKSGDYLWGEFVSMPKFVGEKLVGKIGIARDVTERKKLENELRQSKKDLEIIFSQVGMGITVQSPSGELIFANNAAARQVGFKDAKELVQTPVKKIIDRYEILTADGKPYPLEEFPGRLALAGQHPKEVTVKFKLKNLKEVRWSTIKAAPVFDKTGNVVFAINTFNDITEKKEAEEALRDSELKLKFLSHASTVLSSSLDYKKTLNAVALLVVPEIADWCGVDIINEKGELEQVAVAHVDPAKVKWAKELRKINPIDLNDLSGVANVIKTGKSELFPFVTQEMIDLTAEKNRNSKRQKELINRIGLTSVMIVPLKINGKAIGAITFVEAESGKNFSKADLELAEQLAGRASAAIENALLYKQMEEEKMRLNKIVDSAEFNNKKMAAIVESTDDAIIGQDLNTIISSWNMGAQKLYGYSSQEVLGKPITIIVPKDKRQEVREIMEVIKLGEGVDHLETVRLRKDGRQIDVSLTMSPLKDSEGRVVGASGIGRDISESKELERRKDAFIGMASHELKTPITSIKAYIQILQSQFKDMQNELAVKYLNKTDEQLNNLTELVNDLLDLSKIQTGKLELKKQRFNLGALVSEIVEDMQQINSTYKIQLEENANVFITGDKNRLGQVLINLINNGIKYSPQSDKMIVRTEVDANKITIYVKDFGIGISKTHQKRIFDRFYRAAGNNERTFPGLGIGLYISSEIMRRHGGTIGVESVKRKGSTFFICLPIK